LNTDILNCGMCGHSCFASVPPNASVAGCSSGACVYTCNAGTYDLNGDLHAPGSNGCEYSCIRHGQLDRKTATAWMMTATGPSMRQAI
jgi:hypothetical protein